MGGSYALDESGVVLSGCRSVSAVGGWRLGEAGEQPAASPTLDYQFSRLVAVFLHKREGHTRCAACHTVNNVMTMHLVPLSPGATT
jgi:hypothetical protein